MLVLWSQWAVQSRLREEVTDRRAVAVNMAPSLGEDRHCTLSKSKQVKRPGTETQLPGGVWARGCAAV